MKIYWTECESTFQTYELKEKYLLHEFRPGEEKVPGSFCQLIGGHCFENSDIILNPSQLVRTCKHCGKQQIGHPQESICWSDVIAHP